MKAISIIKYLFTIVGGVLLVIAFINFQNTRVFLESAITAEGVVTGLDTAVSSSGSTTNSSRTYAPIVNFRAGGGENITFISSIYRNPTGHSVGDKVGVLYLPDIPAEARIKSMPDLWGSVFLLSALGIPFFLIGFSIIIFGMMKRRKSKYLQTNGVKVETKLHSIERNGGIEVNGTNPYQILTQWKNPSTSKIHIFKSDNIRLDPSEFVPEKVFVFIDGNNPKRYYVDISFLPEAA
ncbi:MAG: DUF3592 domain-containing protein [Candidatus Thiodiazotropha sp. (ex Monitilora ramsayi)]|nr:DUF3592 domain-containing protein [Candidatus Thiodiazotropha sp. (ex Monitilora ramsayi)]